MNTIDLEPGEDPKIAEGLRALASAGSVPGRSRAPGPPIQRTRVVPIGVAIIAIAVTLGVLGRGSLGMADPAPSAAGDPPQAARASISAPVGTPLASPSALISPDPTGELPEFVVEQAPTVREVFQFDSLGEMLATSTLVVEASVASIEPGRVLNLGSDHEVRVDLVELRVIHLFKGGRVGTLVLEDDGLLAARSNRTDTGIYFLMEKRDKPGLYRLTSSAGRLRLDASGMLHGSNPENALSRSLEQLTLSELRDEVTEAAAAAARGEYAPVPYPTPAP